MVEDEKKKFENKVKVQFNINIGFIVRIIKWECQIEKFRIKLRAKSKRVWGNLIRANFQYWIVEEAIRK